MVDSLTGTILSTHSHLCPPIAYDGRVYIVVRDSGTDNNVEIWSNTQPLTDSWTFLDTFESSNDNSVAARQNGSTIAMLSIDGDDDIEFSEFDMDTDTFNEEDTLLLAQSDVGTTEHWVDIAALANGDLVAVFGADRETVSHSARDRVRYLLRVSGTWETVANDLDDGGSVDYKFPVVTNLGNDIHFAYYDGSDIQHKSLISSTLSSAEACNDTAVASNPEPRIASYTNGATERFVIGWIKSSDSHGYVSFVDSDGTPSAEADATNEGILSWQINTDDTNDEIFVVFVDSTSFDLDYARYDGSWSQGLLQFEITAELVGGISVYVNDDSDTVAGYFWQNNGSTNIQYDEFVLQTGSVTRDFSASDSAAITGTSNLSVTRDYSASDTASITGTSSLSVTRSFVASDTASISGVSILTLTRAFVASDSASITGTSNLSVQRDFTASDTASINGTSNLSITRDFVATDSASISGASDLTATVAALDFSASDSASITGVSNLSVTRAFSASDSASISGTSGLSVTRAFTASDSASINGNSSLAITRSFSSSDSASITGTSNLSILRDFVASDTASINGASDLTATSAALDFSASDSAVITGTSNLSITRDYSATDSASVTGASNLAVTRAFTATDSASISGMSNLDVTRDFTATDTASITGSSDLTATSTITHDFSASDNASLSGTSNLGVVRAFTASDSASITGSSDLTADAILEYVDLIFIANRNSLTFVADKDALEVIANRNSIELSVDKDTISITANKNSLTLVGDYDT